MMTVSVQSLNHIYPGRPNSLEAVRDINLEIEAGEFVALVGPSGCGKSTLLRILAGLAMPTRGSAQINGYSPLQAAAEKQIGWLAQNPALLPWRTVRANVALAQQINPQNSRTLMPPDALLEMVGLSDFSGAYPFALSGGMQQRVALARTLALGAKVWLMDEPFAALDELTREVLTRELLEIWRTLRPTVLWVTHHILEAARLADRVLVMTPRPGQISAEVRLDLPRPRDEETQEFIQIIAELRGHLGVSTAGVHSQIGSEGTNGGDSRESS